MDAMQVEKAVKVLGDKPTLTNFIEYFEVFAQGTGGVDQLKDLILAEAIKGKLVKQDLEEEHGDALIKKIAIKKTECESNKSITRKKKASKESPEYLDGLPANWGQAKLADLMEVYNGRAYKKNELLDSGTPVLRVGNLFTSKHWYYSDLDLEPNKYCEDGDLLYAWSASFGPFIWSGPKSIYHYHIWKLDLFSNEYLNKKYIYTYLLEKTQEIKASGHGIAMVHMTKEKMENLVIPVPPLEEQKRIVAKVDELMALCDQLQAQQQQQANTLLKANAAAIHALLSAEPGLTTKQKADRQNPKNKKQHAFTTDTHNTTAENTSLQGSNLLEQSRSSCREETFKKAWQRIEKNFHTLYGNTLPMPPGQGRQKKYFVGLGNLKRFRLTILELAMLGRLTKQDCSNSSAGLISKLVSEGERLREEKGIRKVKKIYLPEGFIPPQVIPENWEWVSLDTICYQVTDGAHHTPVYIDTGVPFISVKDLTKGSISFENTRFVSDETHKELSARCNPEFGDMLLTKVGTTGVARYVDVDRPFSLFVSVALLKYYQPALDSGFFEYLLNSPLVKKQSDEGTQGVGNKNLVLKTIKAFYLPIPPMEEQKRIVTKVDQLMKICDQIEHQLTTAYADAEKLINATIKQLVA